MCYLKEQKKTQAEPKVQIKQHIHTTIQIYDHSHPVTTIPAHCLLLCWEVTLTIYYFILGLLS